MSSRTPPELAISSVVRRVRVAALREVTDHTLLARFVANRDDLAFEALVRRHGGPVFRTCRRLLVAREDAEDAFQAVFLVLTRKAKALRRGDDLRRWLLAVAYRVAKKAQVRAARRDRVVRPGSGDAIPAVANEDPASAPDYPLGMRELAEVLEAEIRNLPDELREAFELCHRLEYTREDAARALGCSLATLQRRLREARRVLRHRLRGRLQPERVPLSTVLVAGGLAGAEFVPGELVQRVVENALSVCGPDGLALPGAVVLLAGQALPGSGGGLFRLVVVAVLGLAFVGTGLWLWARSGEADRPGQAIPAEPRVVPKVPPAPARGEPRDPERLLHEVVAPRVLAILHKTGGTAELREVRLDRQTGTAHVLADFLVEPLEKGVIHIRYRLADGKWELWTNLYHGGDLHPVNPDKPIILARVFGYEISLKLKAVGELQEAFAVLGPSEIQKGN
jgi:RNA polymerase sigma factor (sigma-70 family)